MTVLTFDANATESSRVKTTVETFLDEVETLEKVTGATIVIHQDGVQNSYYIRCCIQAKVASRLVDLNARLDPETPDSFRANRELLLGHNTYKRMRIDAEKGREFNDIIVEHNLSYEPARPLKVWGGQHRSRAIQDAMENGSSELRYHGFRIYFHLSKKQRSELALISNTNIAVSNDLFDRQLEETMVGHELRHWCASVGLLRGGEDFPDQGSRSEKITVQSARSFIVNFYLGRERGRSLTEDSLDKHTYDPYFCQSGVVLDEQYRRLVESDVLKIWTDKALKQAGAAFAELHQAQSAAIQKSANNRRSFRLKALTASVLSGWSYVAGLLQSQPPRLQNHLALPPPARGSTDRLNAEEMSQFKHDQDPPTYRGLGTRSAIKDRQRMAQLFLARSLQPGVAIDKRLMNQAVSQVIGLRALRKGYRGRL